MAEPLLMTAYELSLVGKPCIGVALVNVANCWGTPETVEEVKKGTASAAKMAIARLFASSGVDVVKAD